MEVLKRLKKRKNFNKDILNKFKNIQLPLDYKKKNSNFIIKNDFGPCAKIFLRIKKKRS